MLRNAYCNIHTLGYALLGVEIRHGAIDVEKNRLNNLFCFTGIPHNPEGYVKNEAMVTIKKNGCRILAPGGYSREQLLVCEQTDIFRGRTRAGGAGEAHLGASS